MFTSLEVLKNPGYRSRQVCDFAQGDIRSRVPGDLDLFPSEVGIENVVTVERSKKKRKRDRYKEEGDNIKERDQNDRPTLDLVINR